jgi:hypothetical protein
LTCANVLRQAIFPRILRQLPARCWLTAQQCRSWSVRL